METADVGLDFSAAKAREWRVQLIRGFKEMCDSCFVFREVFRGMGLKDFRQVMSESVGLVDVAARPRTKGCPIDETCKAKMRHAETWHRNTFKI
jgi:hypothetical protein